MRFALLLALLSAGCMASGSGGSGTSSAELECAAEQEAFEATCDESGDDSLECELAAESVRTACVPDGKGDGVTDWLGSMWINDGRSCYEARDLECLRGHFRKLVRAWRYVYRYPQAARAMENFLDCQVAELTIPREAFEANLEPNPSFPEALSVGELLAMARTEAEAQAAAATADYATFDLGSPLVVPASENVRFALGRTTVQMSADFVRDGSRSWITIHYALRDRYDFHPDRIDDHSRGIEYAYYFPYHAWAAALVDAGRACTFDHVGAWDETIARP